MSECKCGDIDDEICDGCWKTNLEAQVATLRAEVERLTPAGGWRMSGWATEAEARKEAAAQLRALADRIEADELPVAEGEGE